MSVSFSAANFLTGAVTAELPVTRGAKWSQTLNKHDSIDITIPLRDAENRALNLDAVTTPWQSVIFAEESATGATVGTVLVTDRSWDNDARTLSLTVIGIAGYWDKAIIGPPSAATAQLTLATGRPNTALDTVYTNVSKANAGRRLVAQWLSWDGATMPFILPANETGTETFTYPFLDGRTVGSALTDLTAQDQGPDFQFTSRRVSGSTAVPQIEFLMRAGTKNNPYLGSYVGSWSEGGERSPVTKLMVEDDASDQASHAFGTGAATIRSVLWARSINTSMVANGYPPMVTWDSSHSSEASQSNLNAYVRENLNYAAGAQRTLSFTLKNSLTGGTGPSLGNFSVGDMADIDVAEGNYWLKPGAVPIRITSISGNETGEFVDIQCVIWPRS